MADTRAEHGAIGAERGTGLGSAQLVFSESLDEVLPYAISTGRGETEQAALLDLGSVVGGECLAYVFLRLGYLYGHLAARELPVLADAEEWMRTSFPRTQPTDDRSVPLTFWSAEAAEWLRSHDSAVVERELTLAQLFALRAGDAIEESVGLGFSP